MFRKRPLFLCCTFYIAASALAFCLNSTGKLVAVFGLLLAVIVLLIVSLFGKLEKIRAAVFGIAAVFAAIAIMASYLFFDYDLQNKRKLYGKNCDVCAVVTDRLTDNGSYAVYGIKLKSLDGKRENYKALLECRDSSDLQVGFLVSFSGTVGSLEESRVGYDTKILLSDGYKTVFTLDNDEDDAKEAFEKIKILDENYRSISIFAARLNDYFSTKLRMEIGNDGGALAGALFLGNRNHIPKGVFTDFRRAGVSHILALSGMHVAILIGVLDFILRYFRAKRNFRIVLICGIATLYLILTGCSVSASRAVFMVLVAYSAKFIGRRADTLTSLALVGTVIMMISPESVCDISYWLSFLATFGIVVGNEAFEGYIRKIRKFASKHKFLKIPIYIAASIGMSLCANAAIMCVVWLFFGELSVMSPISTLLMSPLAYVLVVLTLLYLAFSWLPYFSAFIALLTGKCAEAMALTANIFAKPDFAVISLRFRLAGAVIISMTFLTILLLSLKLRKKYLIAAPFLLSTVILTVTIFVCSSKMPPKVTYINNRRSDLLLVTSEKVSAVCDITNGNTNYYPAIEALKHNGKTFTTDFVLTHYHTGQATNIENFILSFRVKNVHLPMPTSSEELIEMRALATLLKKHEINTFVYDIEKDATVNLSEDISLVIRRKNVGNDKNPTISVTVRTSERSLEYIGRSQSRTELWRDTERRAAESDYLIFGSHGPINKADYSFTLNSEINKTVLFTSSDTLKYVRPTNDDLPFVLKRVKLVANAEWYEFIMEETDDE